MPKYEEPEKILCAAINVRGKRIYKGIRHGDCIWLAVRFGEKPPIDTATDIQGFWTNKNRFVDRYKASKIAFDAGQIKTKIKKLYSEDLY